MIAMPLAGTMHTVHAESGWRLAHCADKGSVETGILCRQRAVCRFTLCIQGSLDGGTLYRQGGERGSVKLDCRAGYYMVKGILIPHTSEGRMVSAA